MNVLLIMPPHDVKKKFALDAGTAVAPTSPPVALGYLASALRLRGHTPHIIDAPALGWSMSQAAQAVANEAPDVIGVPCYTIGRTEAYEMVRRLKVLLPDTPLVMGGLHVTNAPDQVMEECPEASLLLRGEAEFTLAELVSRLAEGRSYADIPGIYFRAHDGAIVSTPIRWEPDLDAIPFPARDLFDMRLYNPLPIMATCPPSPCLDIIGARGCSWARCRFCYASGRHAAPYRRRSVENVIAELRALVHRGQIRLAHFREDNLTNDHTWTYAFCDALNRERWDLKWMGHARVDTVTPELLKRMGAAGCINLIYGMESGNQATLDRLNKGTSLEQARLAVKWTRDAGIDFRGNWMIAIPGETVEMEEKTFRFAAELNAPFFELYPYQVFPQTPLAEQVRCEGLFPEHDSPSMFSPHYIPPHYRNAAEIDLRLKSFQRRYYLRPRYLASALWRARNPRVLLDYARKSLLLLDRLRRAKTDAPGGLERP